jgi:hypothetical protein
MTAIQTHISDDRGSRPSILKVAIALCLILLMLLAVVHVADGHSVASSADRCPICVVMHSVAPLLIVAVLIAMFRTGTHAPEQFEDRPIVRYWYPSLFTRPPPAKLPGASFRLQISV